MALRGLTKAVRAGKGAISNLRFSRFSDYNRFPTRLGDIRRATGKPPKYQPIVGKSRTLANAFVDIGGRKSEFVGISKRNDVDLEKLVEKNGRDLGFGKPRLAPDLVDIHDGNHAENRILELLKGELNPTDSGTSVFFINHPGGKGSCSTCRSRLEEFARAFKNIDLLVYELD